MIWSTVWIEAVVFTALFTAMVMIPTIKHPEIGVHNYPPDIQEEYFKTHEHVPVAPLSGRTITFKGFGIVLFAVLLTYGAILAGADSFWTGAEFAAILFLIVGAWVFPRLGAVRASESIPPAGDRAHGQGLRAEVVPREGDALPGLAVSRHHQRAHGPSCDVGQVSKKEKKACRFLKIPASPRALAGS